MRKLIFDRHNIVIFLEETELYLLDAVQDGILPSAAAQAILELAEVHLPDEKLQIECFEKGNQRILFVSGCDADSEILYRFDNADHLMDAFRSVRQEETDTEHSELYALQGKYYLLLTPPYPIRTQQLREFADLIANPDVVYAHLREHGQLLAAPAAWTELAASF